MEARALARQFLHHALLYCTHSCAYSGFRLLGCLSAMRDASDDVMCDWSVMCDDDDKLASAAEVSSCFEKIFYDYPKRSC